MLCRHDLAFVSAPAWRTLLEARPDLAGYLTVRSDLDMLLPMPPPADVARLVAELAAIERTAPMRLDGELVRRGGAAVNWRELHEGAGELLVKTTDDAHRRGTRAFLGEAGR